MRMYPSDLVVGAKLLYKGAPYVVETVLTVGSAPLYDVYLKSNHPKEDGAYAVHLSIVKGSVLPLSTDFVRLTPLKEGLVDE